MNTSNNPHALRIPVKPVVASANPSTSRKEANISLLAAKDDDDVMDQPQQQQQSMRGVSQHSDKWRHQLSAAKHAWGKLSEDDLLESEGREQALVDLVEERYDLTHNQADMAVKTFFEKHPS